MTTLAERFELVVIGAGPAGLRAATEAANLGVEVLVVDEQPRPGGQVYRGVATAKEPRPTWWSADYQRGADLMAAFDASAAEYWPETTVWSLDGNRRLGVLRAGRATIIEAGRLIVASGALERSVPFSGWTLPGVLNAGAAQILLKTTGVVPAGETVIAGSGPLLFLVASQYVEAGVPVAAVLEVGSPASLWRAARFLPKAFTAGDYLARGLKSLRAVRQAGTRFHYGISNLRAESAPGGDDRLDRVSFDVGRANRSRRETVQAQNLLVHFGVVPRLDLTQAAGCRHVWDEGQQCWRVEVDSWGQTSVPGISVIGDSAGIIGARAAEYQGVLAALAAARDLDRLDTGECERRAVPVMKRLSIDLRVRPFLETLHRLPDSLLVTDSDDTVVCRCEEITAGEIRTAVGEGHTDPDQVKAYLRCGMGACQGSAMRQRGIAPRRRCPRPKSRRLSRLPRTTADPAAERRATRQPGGSLMMTDDVVVVGGGLAGSTSALHLAMSGRRVIVIEKDAPGRHASGVNAGGLRQLNRHPAEIPLSLAAAEIWSNIEELLGSDCDVKLSGQVRVAEHEDDWQTLTARAALVESLGFEHEKMIDRDELYRLVPALAPHCIGALYTANDGFARPYHALTAFRRKAQSLGVEYRTGVRVLGIDQRASTWRVSTDAGDIECEVVVNCAGAWADKLCAALDEPVPLDVGAPMMMVTERLPHFLDPVVGAASRKLSFKQMQNGTVLIGGAHLARHDLDTQTTELDFEKLAESCRTVTDLFPAMAGARIVRGWAGLEAFMPDQIPVIGPSSTAPGVYHAFGFSAHGFQLSPAVGRAVAELVQGGESSFDLAPFSIERFQPLAERADEAPP